MALHSVVAPDILCYFHVGSSGSSKLEKRLAILSSKKCTFKMYS